MIIYLHPAPIARFISQILPDINHFFLLQWGFLYVRSAVKIIVYVSDEWADAHFFFPKRLAKKGCTIVAGSGLGMRAVMPGESGAMHP